MKNLIREMREIRGMSQLQLAEKLKITQQAISQYENGFRNPKIETLTKIAEVLGFKITVTITDEEA